MHRWRWVLLGTLVFALCAGSVSVWVWSETPTSPSTVPTPTRNTATESPGTEAEPESELLTSLPSSLRSGIPDVLRRNLRYQSAALATAEEPLMATTESPAEALVNIYCTYQTEEYVRTTTGTGFFVDEDGVILTNAHVAQFLLFDAESELGDTECVVRAGNPAEPQYRAELLYLPPAWVQENASVIHEDVPMGTGERDYALLYVHAGHKGAELPEEFPALPVDTNLLPVSTREQTVTAAGYPATNLIEQGPSAELAPATATTTVSELYTFGSNYADVIAVRGSSVGVEGVSGGPLLNAEGAVIGLIVTRGNDEADGTGSLRAITLSHISRTIEQETGFTLERNLAGNLAYRSELFTTTLAPFLRSLLEQEAPAS